MLDIQINDERAVHVEHIWGTVITIDVRMHRATQEQRLKVKSAIHDVVQWLQQVDEVFSTYKEHSIVSQIRRNENPYLDLAVNDVIKRCEKIRDLTDGAFDPWAVTGGFDPSGLVKGWAADRAAGILLDAGFPDFMINAGGDVVVRGEAEAGSDWVIGIQHPTEPGQVCDHVTVRNLSVATSGLYERGEHIVTSDDSELACTSATVIGPDAATADALATALLIKGHQGMHWFAGLPQWSGHFVVGDRTFTFGPAFGVPTN